MVIFHQKCKIAESSAGLHQKCRETVGLLRIGITQSYLIGPIHSCPIASLQLTSIPVLSRTWTAILLRWAPCFWSVPGVCIWNELQHLVVDTPICISFRTEPSDIFTSFITCKHYSVHSLSCVTQQRSFLCLKCSTTHLWITMCGHNCFCCFI